MNRIARHGSLASALLVGVLLLSQWAGVSIVLCISGSDHVRVEVLDAICCLRGDGPHGGFDRAEAGCGECTDVSLEAAADWRPSRRQDPDSGLVALAALALPLAPSGALNSAGCSRALPAPLDAPFPADFRLRC